MRHPIISLLVAIGLFLLAGAFHVSVSGVKGVFDADGQLMTHPNGRPMLVADPYADIRTNWASYLCLAGSVASLGWTLFLVACGLVFVVRNRETPDRNAEEHHGRRGGDV